MDILCLRYLNHPLYNQILGYENGIGCVTFNSEVVGPVSVTSAKLLDSISCTVTFSDSHTISCQWMCIHCDGTDAVVYYGNTESNVSRLVSTSKVRSNAMHLLHTHYMSIKGHSTEIYKSPNVMWCTNSVYSVINASGDTIVCVCRSTLDGYVFQFESIRKDPSSSISYQSGCILFLMK